MKFIVHDFDICTYEALVSFIIVLASFSSFILCIFKLIYKL